MIQSPTIILFGSIQFTKVLITTRKIVKALAVLVIWVFGNYRSEQLSCAFEIPAVPQSESLLF